MKEGSAKAGLFVILVVRSGGIWIDSDRLGSPGQYGYSWTTQAGSIDTSAYRLLFHTPDIGPSTLAVRWFSIPLRCLAD